MAVDVWLFGSSPEGTVIFNPDGSVRETIGGAQRAEPSLTLDGEALKAIIAEGGDHLPPSGAMQRHLDDAIGVRDRLLSLVEERWKRR
jgi:hypothetical protein